jgi:hypothetical protein
VDNIGGCENAGARLCRALLRIMLERASSAGKNQKLIEIRMAVKANPPFVWNGSHLQRFDVEESKNRAGSIFAIK